VREGEEEIRALLVEDDDEDAAIFCRQASRLEEPRLTLTRVASEQEALARLDAEQFDLVFVDLNLAGRGSGMNLLERLQRSELAVPTIVVTGSGDEVRAVEAMKAGAHDYLVKDTLTPEQLERSIRNVRERHTLEQERARMVAKLAELSVTDELTGIANRRYLVQKMEEEVRRSERTGHLFSLLMIDLDHFKLVNDRFGHQKGDEVLRQVAATLERNIRRTDSAGRYGGEEFCVLLPETGPAGACRVAEKLREAVKGLPDPVPTISIGVAFWEPYVSMDDILRRVDEALYEAKAAGRDRVVVHRGGKAACRDAHGASADVQPEFADRPATSGNV